MINKIGRFPASLIKSDERYLGPAYGRPDYLIARGGRFGLLPRTVNVPHPNGKNEKRGKNELREKRWEDKSFVDGESRLRREHVAMLYVKR
jgi:hypothetical protein